ncbi:DNA repair protein [Trichonephila clavipes]|nr:DNA repair protein [Trichonephila clavipes]
MTGQRYINEVLLPHVRLFRGAVGDKFVFMDDNATCHRTLAVQDCLDSEGIQHLVWPARSPDLNPIENAWDALRRQVVGRNYPPTNKNTLIRALTEEWDKLPQQLLDNVVQSMLEDINIFLIACMGDDTENKSLEDYLKEFEKQRQLKLSPSEKHVFSNKYLDLFHGNVLTSEFNSTNISSVSPPCSPNSITECNSPGFTERTPSVSPEIVCLDSDDQTAEVPSFDLTLATPGKRKSSTANGDRKTKHTRKSLIPQRHSSPTELLHTRPEDFIQFDGVQPSTSSGITYADCPICRDLFPSSEIEKHASTCGDILAANSKFQDEDTFVSCPICSEFYLEKDMNAHIDTCTI